ncbi:MULTISPECIES: phosphonate ABC transporter, permease protein PhnE [Pseudovibrio]|uniref:phosphonate ABC transporter, permease protein PhnE n=1 Tax=Stappiaceae TaxID=2821832 RepID=UPI0023657DF6|nr:MULTISPECIES: phosphonate ABC transporter, permease protein PhnE [Pseudovibrio]MDD7908347.1 phosphonate ABC transporter, permease protein PhnE [Pseudovibrio exalbescens]MDX5595676.1 phosphonate ABC transporter, permease protein PhnE [Pseudovibrio sp. SPO723]
MALVNAFNASPHLAEIEKAYEQVARQRTTYTFLLLLVCLVSIVGGFYVAEEANSGSFWGGISSFGDYPYDILAGAYERGWGLFSLVVKYFPFLVETLNIALVSTLVGFFFSSILSFFASRNLMTNRGVVFVVRRALDITRAFPELVIALMLVLIFGPSPIAAIMAVTFHTIGALGKLFSETNENADMKAVEGLKSVGANWVQQMRLGILPQVLPNFLSYALLRLEINVRASAILGFVGAGGLGAELKMVVDWNYGADIFVIIVMLVCAITAIDYFSGWLRRKLIGTSGTL